MTTLNDFMNLMPYAALDFGFDSFIQIVDYTTGAHYRRSADEENLELGGNPILCSMAVFMKIPVRCIEYIDNQCVVSVGY